MALKKVVLDKKVHSGRVISIGKDGSFLVSTELSDEIRKIKNLSVEFYQDDKIESDWYIRFGSDCEINVVAKDEKSFAFYSKEIRRKIFSSLKKKEVLFGRVRIRVAKSIVKDTVEVYPLITANIIEL